MPGSSPASKPAKTMSSRLLTMKFMQRAATSSVEEPDTPSPKRPRLSADSRTETPTSDFEAVQAALAAEEQKRADAITRQAAEAGETNWVLNFSNSTPSPIFAHPTRPMIVAADSLDAENQGSGYGGRTSYGNFKRKKNLTSADVDAANESPKTDEMKEKERRKMNKNVDKVPITSISGERDSSYGIGTKQHGGKSRKKRSK